MTITLFNSESYRVLIKGQNAEILRGGMMSRKLAYTIEPVVTSPDQMHGTYVLKNADGRVVYEYSQFKGNILIMSGIDQGLSMQSGPTISDTVSGKFHFSQKGLYVLLNGTEAAAIVPQQMSFTMFMDFYVTRTLTAEESEATIALLIARKLVWIEAMSKMFTVIDDDLNLCNRNW